MKKMSGVAVPFAGACLMLGMLFYMVEVTQAYALASPSLPQGAILVNTISDELNNDGDCSLREAIQAANNNAKVDACSAGGVFTDTITFGVAGTIVLASELKIENNGPVIIDGGEAITIGGGGTTRIFYLDFDAQVILEGLILTNGYAGQGGAILNWGSLVITDTTITDNIAIASGGGIYNLDYLYIANSTISGNSAGGLLNTPGNGGGIYNTLYATLIIENCSVTNNTVTGYDGGGIDNDSVLLVINSIISNNSAGRSGGGIQSNYGPAFIMNSILDNNTAAVGYGGGILNANGPMEIINSTISDNNVQWNGGGGGGIYNSEVMTITNSTLSGNSAKYYGGGIYNMNKLTIDKSTLSANSLEGIIGGTVGGYGGGIYNGSRLSITNSTLSGNTAANYGGGIYNGSFITITFSTLAYNSTNGEGGGLYNNPGVPRITLKDSIISNSMSGGNCAGGPISDQGHNIEDMNSCGLNPAAGSLHDVDPRLGALQDNGGSTWTHALLSGSPAIDSGERVLGIYSDQRGFYRPMDGDDNGSSAYDIGSFELEGPIIYQNPEFLPLIVISK